MFDPSLLAERLESQVSILMQCRNLTAYIQATTPGAEGSIVQISQRLQAVIGGLTQEAEQIRLQGKQFDESLIRYLSSEEWADLMSLNRSYSDLDITMNLLGRFRQQLIRVAHQRQQAGDVRQ